ncbi:MAG: peptidylprolyl isomerase [Clostridia bacterium]|jgi:peptidyl-prolyl cis-trans isomerase B (cyclophilin B)|nr:peptidylprolyl isomerase [Clostridia bacterium]
MNTPKIKIVVRDYGEMTAELYPEKAPKTVENFLALIEQGFFSGMIFHRVISGFMIQGGGYDESFEQKEAAAIKGEFRANGFVQNDLKHTRGVLSMARTQDPNSASSQFFIMHQDAPYLDAQYAGFGKVTEGIEVVDKIAAVKTGRMGWFDDVPKTPVVIEKMEILER